MHIRFHIAQIVIRKDAGLLFAFADLTDKLCQRCLIGQTEEVAAGCENTAVLGDIDGKKRQADIIRHIIRLFVRLAHRFTVRRTECHRTHHFNALALDILLCKMQHEAEYDNEQNRDDAHNHDDKFDSQTFQHVSSHSR